MAGQQQWPRGQNLNLRTRETRVNTMPGMTTREMETRDDSKMRWQLQLAQQRESGHRPKQKRGRLSGLRRRLRRQQQHSTTLTKQVRSLRSMLVEKKFVVQRMQNDIKRLQSVSILCDPSNALRQQRIAAAVRTQAAVRRWIALRQQQKWRQQQQHQRQQQQQQQQQRQQQQQQQAAARVQAAYKSWELRQQRIAATVCAQAAVRQWITRRQWQKWRQQQQQQQLQQQQQQHIICKFQAICRGWPFRIMYKHFKYNCDRASRFHPDRGLLRMGGRSHPRRRCGKPGWTIGPPGCVLVNIPSPARYYRS